MTYPAEDYEAVNGKGMVVATFNTLTLARSWMRQNAHLHAGLHIDSVERRVLRRTIIPSDHVDGYLKMAGGRR